MMGGKFANWHDLPLPVEKIDSLLRHLQSSCNHFFQLIHSIHLAYFHFKRSPCERGDCDVEVVGRGVITGGQRGGAGGAGRGGGRVSEDAPPHPGLGLDSAPLAGVGGSGVITARILGIHSDSDQSLTVRFLKSVLSLRTVCHDAGLRMVMRTPGHWSEGEGELMARCQMPAVSALWSPDRRSRLSVRSVRRLGCLLCGPRCDSDGG